jgi:hypothetical protein
MIIDYIDKVVAFVTIKLEGNLAVASLNKLLEQLFRFLSKGQPHRNNC